MGDCTAGSTDVFFFYSVMHGKICLKREFSLAFAAFYLLAGIFFGCIKRIIAVWTTSFHRARL
jgi:hypothetical protein